MYNLKKYNLLSLNKNYFIIKKIFIILLLNIFCLIVKSQNRQEVIGINFDVNGGDTAYTPYGLAYSTINGNYYFKPPYPKGYRKGYDFVMWGTTPNSTGADSVKFAYNGADNPKITAYAIWKLRTNTLTFNTNGMPGVTAPATQNIVSFNKATKPADLSSSGYTFIGWGNKSNSTVFDLFDFKNNIDTILTIYAIWKQGTTYDLSFNINQTTDTNVIIPPTQKLLPNSDKALRPTISRIGYDILMWGNSPNSTGADSFNFSTNTISTNKIIYAIWQPKSYTITFNYNDNNVTPTINQNVLYGSSTNRPTSPTKSNQVLAFWSTSKTSTVKDSFSFVATKKDTLNYTLYALWQNSPFYYINFDMNGGDVNQTPQKQLLTSVNADATYKFFPSRPNNLIQRKGYNFQGWAENRTIVGGLTAIFTDGITTDNFNDKYTLYAIWQAKTNTITFNSNGVSVTAPNSQSIVSGNYATKPANLSASGYTFMGWGNKSNSANTDTFAFSSQIIDTNYTIYAIWQTGTSYTLSFDLNGSTEGQIPSNQLIASGTKGTRPINPTRATYNFIGWGNSATSTISDTFNFSTTNITADKKLYALWQLRTYTVIIDYNDGVTPNITQQNIIYGSKATPPPLPKYRRGYDFFKWSTIKNNTDIVQTDSFQFNTKLIDTNYIVYGIWKPYFNKINFYMNDDASVALGRVPLTRPDGQTITSGQLATRPPNPFRKGFTFVMWGNKPTSTGADSFKFSSQIIDTNYDINAIWQANTNIITFNINGGVSTAPNNQNIISLNYAIRPTNPTPQTGYSFLGWSTTANGSDTFYFTKTPVDTNYNLYAIYNKAGTYKVSFNMNGGDVNLSPPSQDVPTAVGKNYIVRPNNPYRKGYSFEGWLNSNSSIIDTFDFKANTVNENKILYAYWLPKSNLISFNLNGGNGTAPANQNINTGSTVVRPPNPTRTNYGFLMWGFSATSTGADSMAFNSKIIDTNYTLYAIWQTVNTISFDLNGATGTAPSSQTIISGNKATKPTDPIRAGYTFIGWATTNTGTTAVDFNTFVPTSSSTLYAIWNTISNYNDVRIDSFVGPFSCDSFKLILAFTNKGNGSLAKTDINIYINDKLTETFAWTGNLAQNLASTVTLKNTIINIRDKVIKAVFSNPNGFIDMVNSDNEIKKSLDQCILVVPDFSKNKPSWSW